MSADLLDARAHGGRARMSPRRRARVVRGVQYAVLVLIVVAVAVATDWARVGNAFFNPAAARAIVGDLPRAALNTIVYTLAAFGVGLGLGLVLALMKLSSVRAYRIIATGYVEFFRGIPALLVVFAFGYGVPAAFQIRFDSIVLQIALALGIVSAAYIAETLRAGIQAVPKGQVEAARSLGMTSGQTLLHVVVPQAFRIVLPPLTNEVVLLTKDTSLVFALGLFQNQYELTKVGRNALTGVEGGMTSLLAVGLVYLLITIPMSGLTRWLEKTTGSKGHV
ncbi:MAG TPA: amino acid ABC transporter permease [Actinotalea sp.]